MLNFKSSRVYIDSIVYLIRCLSSYKNKTYQRVFLLSVLKIGLILNKLRLIDQIKKYVDLLFKYNIFLLKLVVTNKES
jgi:hypothetical protein